MFERYKIVEYLKKIKKETPTEERINKEIDRFENEYSSQLDSRFVSEITPYGLSMVESILTPKAGSLSGSQKRFTRAEFYDKYFDLCFMNKKAPSAFYGYMCLKIAAKMAHQNTSSISHEVLGEIYEDNEIAKLKPESSFASFNDFLKEVSDAKFTPNGPLLKRDETSGRHQFVEDSLKAYFFHMNIYVEETTILPKFLIVSEDKGAALTPPPTSPKKPPQSPFPDPDEADDWLLDSDEKKSEVTIQLIETPKEINGQATYTTSYEVKPFNKGLKSLYSLKINIHPEDYTLDNIEKINKALFPLIETYSKNVGAIQTFNYLTPTSDFDLPRL